MRLAVVSDVHGNAFALDAVLKELRGAAPDAVLNLGDQIEGTADPARAYALQAELGAVEVRGNNEEKLWPGGRRGPLAQQFGAWLETQVGAAEQQRLAALPLTARVAGDVLACHGTPESAWEMLLWQWQFDDPQTGTGFYRARDPRDLLALVEPLEARVVVCGHTHRPGATRVGDTLVVNAGAVSDQVDGDPRARWTLLERRGGHWSAEFHTAAYDVAAAVAWSQAHSPFGPFAKHLLESGTMRGRGDTPPS
ncbi:metallophosphatase family protein [Deinococcus sp. KNUC1210]|uniref:metallophosphoesterase family protein n=1 Tax=Deinococcus sp. KNUC1210 TaxID=2917691 RepID=UPI001EF02C1D|nr:metallophosphoesterase family protein [Deinococcus sp. KNUC1210]ULH16897.1 metallophosphatase family protein [Deinococcus sp. KNUC1210]